MADLKISQLTEVTSPVGADILPIVNAGETKKVSITNLNNSLPLTTFVRGASGSWGGAPAYIQVSHEPPYTGPTDNLPNGTDTYLAWDASTTNDSNTFELVNSGLPDARVLIKSTGVYEFTIQAIYFDLWNDNVFTGSLDFSTASTGSSWTRIRPLFRHIFAGDTSSPPAQIVQGTGQVVITVPNRYYSVALNPSINTPFPGTNGGLATNFLIKKIGV